MKKIQLIFPGLIFSLFWAFIAFVLSHYLPVGAVVIGITLGMLIGNIFKLPEILSLGITFAEKQILSWAIIFMGIRLDFNIIKDLGIKAIVLIIVSIVFTIMISQILSRLTGLNRRLGFLLGIGNGVCGSSAIAATEKIIGADKHEVGIAVTIVNLLGVIGMFLLPILTKMLLHYNDLQSGFLIGNTLQAVGQVIAAGFSINVNVGHTATIVKMMRILMLTPIVLSLIMFFHQKNNRAKDIVKKQGIPIFIIGFILMSLVPSFHLLPSQWIDILGKISHYLLLIAMVAIGLKVHFKSVLRYGQKSLLVGTLIFLVQILFSVLTINFFIR